MSSEIWFAHFERLDAEHPGMSEDELSEMAEQAVRDDLADRVDAAMDELSEGGGYVERDPKGSKPLGSSAHTVKGGVTR